METALSLKVIILWLSVVFTIILSYVFLFADTRSRSYRGYALSGIMASMWGFGISMFYLVDLNQALFWAKVLYFAGGMVAVAFLYFSLAYTNREHFSKYIFPFIGVVQLSLFVLYFSTNIILSGVYETNGVRGILYGPGHILFDICFYFPFVFALFWLLQKALRSKDNSRIFTFFVFFGSSLAVFLAAITNIILPWFGNFLFFWWGPPLSLVWMISNSYSIIRYSLLRSGILVLEFFAGLFGVFFLVGSFFPSSITLKVFIFIGLIVLIGALIRSGLNEVRQKEELKKLTSELEDLNNNLQEKVDEQTKEITRAYEVEKTARKKLEEVDKIKSEFISVAAHQLRTPLAGIRWALSALLGNKNVTDEQGQILNKTYKATTNLINIVQDLLNVTRIEGNEFGFAMEENNIVEVANEALTSSLVLLKNKKIDISFENKALDIQKFIFDREKMIMVLKNLIGNAIDYTKEGGHVALSVAKESEYVLVSISDSGIGMDEEEKTHLFTKFFRSKEARLMETDRSGLGLYIVKEIIDQHKGTITVISRKGEGTRIEIRLPLIQTKAETIS